jgi:surface antigen
MSLTSFGRIAASQIGWRESGDDETRNTSPYGAWYGMQNQPYCAMGLSWVANQSGDAAGMGGKFAYCPYWVRYFQDAGRWGQTPKRGAIVFFNFGRNLAVHVEWVEKVLDDGRIQTIGFNTSSGNTGSQNNGDGVFRRIRSAKHGVEGYGYPKYTPEPVSRTVVRPPITPKTKLAVDGQFGPNTVRALQRFLKVTADGKWGPASKKALQRRLKVTADGVVGPRTVKALQKMIGAKVDGAWGPATTRSLQSFLNNH